MRRPIGHRNRLNDARGPVHKTLRNGRAPCKTLHTNQVELYAGNGSSARQCQPQLHQPNPTSSHHFRVTQPPIILAHNPKNEKAKIENRLLFMDPRGGAALSQRSLKDQCAEDMVWAVETCGGCLGPKEWIDTRCSAALECIITYT